MNTPIVTIIGDSHAGKSRQFDHLTAGESISNIPTGVRRPHSVCAHLGSSESFTVYDTDSNISNIDQLSLYQRFLAGQRQQYGHVVDANLLHSVLPSSLYSFEHVEKDSLPVPRSHVDPVISSNVLILVVKNDTKSISRIRTYWLPLLYLLHCHHQALILVMECVNQPAPIIEYSRYTRISQVMPIMYTESTFHLTSEEFHMLRQCAQRHTLEYLCSKLLQTLVTILSYHISYPTAPLVTSLFDKKKHTDTTEGSTQHAILHTTQFSPLRKKNNTSSNTSYEASTVQLEYIRVMETVLRTEQGVAPWTTEVSTLQLHKDVCSVINRCFVITDADLDFVLNIPELTMFCDMFLPEHVHDQVIAQEQVNQTQLIAFFTRLLATEQKYLSISTICDSQYIFTSSSIWYMLTSTYMTHHQGQQVLETPKLRQLLPVIPSNSYFTLSSVCISVLIQHFQYHCDGAQVMSAAQFETCLSLFPTCVSNVCRELTPSKFPLHITQWVVFLLKLTQVDPVLMLHVLQCIGYTGDAQLLGVGRYIHLQTEYKYPQSGAMQTIMEQKASPVYIDSSIVTRDQQVVQKTLLHQQNVQVLVQIHTKVATRSEDHEQDAKKMDSYMNTHHNNNKDDEHGTNHITNNNNNSTHKQTPGASSLTSLQTNMLHFLQTHSSKLHVHFQCALGLLQNTYNTQSSAYRSVGKVGSMLHAYPQCLLGMESPTTSLQQILQRACPVLPCTTHIHLHTRCLVLGSPKSGKTLLCTKSSLDTASPYVSPVLPFLPVLSMTEPKQGATTQSFPSTPPCIDMITFHTNTGAKVSLTPNVPFLSTSPIPTLMGQSNPFITPSHTPTLTQDEVVQDPIGQIRLCLELAGHTSDHAYEVATTLFPNNTLHLDEMMLATKASECTSACTHEPVYSSLDTVLITMNVSSIESILFTTQLQKYLPPQLPRVVLGTHIDTLPISLYSGVPAKLPLLPSHTVNILPYMTTPRYISSIRSVVNNMTTYTSKEVFASLFPFQTIFVPVNQEQMEPNHVSLNEQGLIKMDTFKYILDMQTAGLTDKLFYSRIAAIPNTPELFIYKEYPVVKESYMSFTRQYLPYLLSIALSIGLVTAIQQNKKHSS